MSDQLKSALRVAVGSGTLTRTEHAVMFIPETGSDTDTLATVFAQSSQSPGAALGKFLVDEEFAVPRFVLVEWGADVSLMVFGDISVTTDQPSLPMLTGAGSATWVEHRLRAIGESAAIMVDAPDESLTDLRSGTVPAGGFRLELTGHLSAPVEMPTPDPDPVDVSPEVEIADGPEPTPAQVGSAHDGPGHPPVPDTDSTLRADEVSALRPSSPPLIDAKVCLNGHAGPPTADVCRVCGTRLDPGDSDIRTVERPRMGVLRFDDGAEFPLDTGCVLGRKPQPPDGSRSVALTLTGDKVSRQHAEVILRDWDVLIADLGSTNGTIIVSGPGAQPIDVEPGAPQSVESGAIIYIGSRSFVFDSATTDDPVLPALGDLASPGHTPPPPPPPPLSGIPDPKSILDDAIGTAPAPQLEN